MKRITIYTDGACSGNPGKGGWGAILIHSNKRKEISGYNPSTTNNRMELTAVIESLLALKEPCEAIIYSDSAYVVNAFNQGWLTKWIKTGWRSAKGIVQNQDLWAMLLKLTAIHSVSFVKVKGHSDNEFNNRCDELARAEITNQGGNYDSNL